MGLEIHCEGNGCFGTLYLLATFPECFIISAPLFSQVKSSQHLLLPPSAPLMTPLAFRAKLLLIWDYAVILVS